MGKVLDLHTLAEMFRKLNKAIPKNSPVLFGICVTCQEVVCENEHGTIACHCDCQCDVCRQVRKGERC